MERRSYSRVDLEIACLIYLDNTEMNGMIVNVSECGIALMLRIDDVKRRIDVGDRILVTGVDEEVVCQFEADVIRTETNDGKMLLGARISNRRQVEEFVSNKKVKAYLALLN